MISKKQKIFLLSLILVLLILWAIIVFVNFYKPGTDNASEFVFNGDKYNIELEEKKPGLFSKQGVQLRVRRKTDKKWIIKLNTEFDNKDYTLSRNNFNVLFEDNAVSVEFISNSGVICGEYQFCYDQLDKIK